MNATSEKKKRNPSGQVLIEIVMALPIFFVFIYGIAEFSNLLVQAQRVSSLSREAANAAYRDCNDRVDVKKADDAEAKIKLNKCVSDEVNQINDGANNGHLLPNFAAGGTVIASLYAFDPVNKVPVLMSQESAGEGGGSSRFDEHNTDLAAITANLGIVGVGEAIYTYHPLIPHLQGFLQWMFGLGGVVIPDAIHETTVF